MTRLIIPSVFLITLASCQSISHSSRNGRPACTVYPGNRNTTDDVPIILQAFEDCGNGGDVIFPGGNIYHINSRLNPVVNDVTIDWQGEWVVRILQLGTSKHPANQHSQFSEDLDYWRNNSYHVEFQNHAAGFVITGDHIRIDGYGTGGINGNGQLWYYAERGDPPVVRFGSLCYHALDVWHCSLLTASDRLREPRDQADPCRSCFGTYPT
jgi:galacturan 1,4-alpha-galacturonidase